MSRTVLFLSWSTRLGGACMVVRPGSRGPCGSNLLAIVSYWTIHERCASVCDAD